jgi:magnesium transporter
MSRFFKRVSKKAGLSPGTLVHIGKKKVGRPRITIIDYDDKRLEEREAKKAEECFPYRQKRSTTWINIDGIHDTELIEGVGKGFGIHPLVLEDIVNTGQRPKMEEFDDYIFVVLKMLSYDENAAQVRAEQVSLVFGKNFLISFQEESGDIFDPLRERLKKGKGRIRKAGADYLAYALLDAVVDNYFTILENFGETIEGMEEGLVSEPRPATLQKIYEMKREMIFMRKAVWPVREVIGGLDRSESGLIEKKTHVYLRDVYDHTIQVIDTVETFRDMVGGMLDLYLSSVSNKMNEVMKVLTIIATIFIPLSFFAGLYGMNFNPQASPFNMPELNHPFGYVALLLFMLLVALGMILYFRRKGWL